MIKILKKIKKKFKLIELMLTRPVNFSIVHGRNTQVKNIIFFLPDSVYPTGGNIVTHHHADRINELNLGNIQAYILFPNNLDFTYANFVHNSKFKRDLSFDPKTDFVVLPEVMVLTYAKKLFDAGIKYGIHVQNGYLMDLEIRSGLGDYQALNYGYQNADFVIGNSLDTIANIKTVFPYLTDKIIHSSFVINKAKYQEIAKKKNIITYMPRKLSEHSKRVLFFLGDKLPKNWSIQPIDGVPEQTVYDIFYESKIFLSFSEFEGLAMPPAMAAMAGNRVIGYTGEANKEYFHLPCFEEVPCGDIKLFVQKLLAAVARFDNDEEALDIESINELKAFFSLERQEEFLKKLAQTVSEKLG